MFYTVTDVGEQNVVDADNNQHFVFCLTGADAQNVDGENNQHFVIPVLMNKTLLELRITNTLYLSSDVVIDKKMLLTLTVTSTLYYVLQMLMDPMGGIVMTNDGNAILREVSTKSGLVTSSCKVVQSLPLVVEKRKRLNR